MDGETEVGGNNSKLKNHRMKNLIPIVLLFVIFSCCQNDSTKHKQHTKVVDTLHNDRIPPLTEGDFVLKEKDFGNIVELKGKSHPVEQIFRVSECEMIALDSIFIVKNLANADMFMAFSLPSFKFIKSFGLSGKGPGEFQSPHLVKDESGKYICYIYESAKAGNALFALDRNMELIKLPFNFPSGIFAFSDKQFHGISSEEFYYVESIEKGKAMFHLEATRDTAKTTLLQDLSFSGKHKNWAAYIGDFGVSGKNKRLVFAYKYFKRILFYDLEHQTSKIISFDHQYDTKEGDAVSMLDPSNVTHYWGMSSNDKYVYILYSGRTPIDVSKELKKSSGYIYIEKFDWNGNPICKYKLDHWGYFCVNAQENTIYLASTTEEQPFFSYRLPDN